MEKLICIQDFEDAAFVALDRNAREYYKSGAEGEWSLRNNNESFSNWLIRPRVLRDISVRNTETNILGKPIAFPVGVSPSAFQALAHSEGECANVKATTGMGSIFILSTFSNYSIEDVAAAAPNGRKWFQLFPNTDKKVTESLIRRAEKAGFEAIVLTLDAQNVGKKWAIIRNPFKFPPNLKFGNFANLETKLGDQSKLNTSISSYVHNSLEQALTWEIIPWIRTITKLPLVVKGILTMEDAYLAAESNVNGIIVSNHGGRQVDTVFSSIDVLPNIVSAVDGRCEVYLDSGVRRGSDVFKAIALGAKMVFVGRPAIWGLAVNGEMGVRKTLEILRDEFDLTMALSGVRNVKEINNCNSIVNDSISNLQSNVLLVARSYVDCSS